LNGTMTVRGQERARLLYRPLLVANDRSVQQGPDGAIKAAFARVLYRFVGLIPGDPWVHSDDMKERFGVSAEESES
jgi:hypothetical protein